MTKAYDEYRSQVLADPIQFPELHRIETLKNDRRFKGESVNNEV